MIVINSQDESHFTLNGVEYFRNYINEVAGNFVRIYNCFTAFDIRQDWTHYSQFIVDDVTYASAELLQVALNNVTFNRMAIPNNGIQQYKFLLTQSGGDDPQTQTSGTTVKGVTYEITAGTDADFTISGAPNNTVGTKFISNGIEPDWGSDGELGYNNGAPVVNEFVNTIGHVWWERRDTGIYDLKSSDAIFVIGKVFVLPNTNFNASTYNFQVTLEDTAPDFISIFSFNNPSSPSPQDGLFSQTSFLIEIFN